MSLSLLLSFASNLISLPELLAEYLQAALALLSIASTSLEVPPTSPSTSPSSIAFSSVSPVFSLVLMLRYWEHLFLGWKCFPVIDSSALFRWRGTAIASASLLLKSNSPTLYFNIWWLIDTLGTSSVRAGTNLFLLLRKNITKASMQFKVRTWSLFVDAPLFRSHLLI